jgi:hypothetical protein
MIDNEPRLSARGATFEDDIDATRFVRAIVRHWVLILTVVVMCGAGSLAIASWTATTYEASAMIVLPAPRETSGLPRTIASARALLTNTGVVTEALRGTHLEQSTTAPEFVRTAIDIDEMAGGQFLRLRVRASHPDLAAAIAKSLVNGALAQGTRVDERSAAETGNQLKRQLDQAAKAFAEAAQRLLELPDQSRTTPITQKIQAVLEERRQVLGLAAGIEGDRPGLRAVEAGRARPRGDQPRTFTDAELQQLEALSARELDLAKLRADYVVAWRVYSDIAVQYEQARVEALAGGTLIRLVDPEIAAGTPLPRDLVRKTMLGLVVGLLLGLAAVILWEAAHPVLRNPVQ